jgi:hypothetical protein
LGIGFLEKIVFGSAHFGAWIQYRVSGGMEATMAPGTTAMNPMAHFTPGKFFGTPGLWIGWLLTVIFFVAAVRIRRQREPI